MGFSYQSFVIILWASYVGIGAVVGLLLWVVDPSTVVFAVVLWLVLAVWLYWRQVRTRTKLEGEGGSVPFPGLLGAMGFEASDEEEADDIGPSPDASVDEEPIKCPKCGTSSQRGELRCQKCGADLWTREPPTPTRSS